jgi:hypothetical protein
MSPWGFPPFAGVYFIGAFWNDNTTINLFLLLHHFHSLLFFLGSSLALHAPSRHYYCMLTSSLDFLDSPRACAVGLSWLCFHCCENPGIFGWHWRRLTLFDATQQSPIGFIVQSQEVLGFVLPLTFGDRWLSNTPLLFPTWQQNSLLVVRFSTLLKSGLLWISRTHALKFYSRRLATCAVCTRHFCFHLHP